MRTTITIDDELFRKAVEVADPGMDKAEIVREAMRMFVRIQSGKRLAALGGAVPRMQDIPRRRAAGRTAR
jgi:Arc/MetJ family transcription regulator